MWFKANTKDELYAALEAVKKKECGEYISGKEQFQGIGWYWLDVRSIYFGRGAYDQIVQAHPAEVRIQEIKDQIKELTDILVTARATVKT